MFGDHFAVGMGGIGSGNLDCGTDRMSGKETVPDDMAGIWPVPAVVGAASRGSIVGLNEVTKGRQRTIPPPEACDDLGLDQTTAFLVHISINEIDCFYCSLMAILKAADKTCSKTFPLVLKLSHPLEH